MTLLVLPPGLLKHPTDDHYLKTIPFQIFSNVQTDLHAYVMQQFSILPTLSC